MNELEAKIFAGLTVIEPKSIYPTKREIFAGMALQGLLVQGSRMNYSSLVEQARELADKLLEELAKE